MHKSAWGGVSIHRLNPGLIVWKVGYRVPTWHRSVCLERFSGRRWFNFTYGVGGAVSIPPGFTFNSFATYYDLVQTYSPGANHEQCATWQFGYAGMQEKALPGRCRNYRQSLWFALVFAGYLEFLGRHAGTQNDLHSWFGSIYCVLLADGCEECSLLVLTDHTFQARCYPLSMNGQIGRPKKVAIPLERWSASGWARRKIFFRPAVQRFEWRTTRRRRPCFFG